MLAAEHTWILSAIALTAGLGFRWLWERFTDRQRTDMVKRQIRAQLLAMRLYSDEPALVWRAQRRLLVWNTRYLIFSLRPAAIVTLPGILLWTQLGAIYGHRPLTPGESAVITARFSDAADLRTLAPTLEGYGIKVVTPPVRIISEHLACWRVHVTSDTRASVVLRIGGDRIAKPVQAGAGLAYLPEIELVSLRGLIRSLEISYPFARIRVFGIAVDWRVWFVAVGVLSMLIPGVFRTRSSALL